MNNNNYHTNSSDISTDEMSYCSVSDCQDTSSIVLKSIVPLGTGFYGPSSPVRSHTSLIRSPSRKLTPTESAFIRQPRRQRRNNQARRNVRELAELMSKVNPIESMDVESIPYPPGPNPGDELTSQGSSQDIFMTPENEYDPIPDPIKRSLIMTTDKSYTSMRSSQHPNNSLSSVQNSTQDLIVTTNSSLMSSRRTSMTVDLVDDLRLFDRRHVVKLAKFHLTQILDFSGESFDDFLAIDPEDLLSPTDPTQTKRLRLAINSHKKLKEKCQIDSLRSTSGSTLTEEGISQVQQLIDFIRLNRNITSEGIFRKSGTGSRQQDLEHMLNCGRTVDLVANRFTVHDCATVLKAFLSKLPEPVFMDVYFKIYLEHISPISSPAKRLEAIQLMLLILPMRNRKFLKDLFCLLHEVTLHTVQNKMDSNALGLMFIPHLFLPRCILEDVIKVKAYVARLQSIFNLIVSNPEEAFSYPDAYLTDVKHHLDKLRNEGVGSKNSSRNVLNSTRNTTKGSKGDLVEDDDGSDPPIDTQVNYCARFTEEATSGQDYTNQQLALLYAQVQSMAPGPAKERLIKRFNKQNGYGTPQAKSSKGLKGSIWSLFSKSTAKKDKKSTYKKMDVSSKKKRSGKKFGLFEANSCDESLGDDESPEAVDSDLLVASPRNGVRARLAFGSERLSVSADQLNED